MYETYGNDFSAVSTFPEVHPDVYLELTNGQPMYDPNTNAPIAPTHSSDMVLDDPRVTEALIRLQAAAEEATRGPIITDPWPWVAGALALALILRR